MATTKEVEKLMGNTAPEDCCPKCKSSILEYGEQESYKNGIYYQFRCPECGFEGQQHYNLVFDCFTDNEGNDV